MILATFLIVLLGAILIGVPVAFALLSQGAEDFIVRNGSKL